MRRVGRQFIAPRQQCDFARDSLLFQQARNYETIAAVVALAGDDQHALLGSAREAFENRRGDPLAGTLHQRQARCSVFLDRQTIQLAHLRSGDNNHGFKTFEPFKTFKPLMQENNKPIELLNDLNT